MYEMLFNALESVPQGGEHSRHMIRRRHIACDLQRGFFVSICGREGRDGALASEDTLAALPGNARTKVATHNLCTVITNQTNPTSHRSSNTHGSSSTPQSTG
jgi:hypothetical protein